MEDYSFLDSKITKWAVILTVSLALFLMFYLKSNAFTIGLISAGAVANYFVYFNLKKRKPTSAKKMIILILSLLAMGVALYFVINAALPKIP